MSDIHNLDEVSQYFEFVVGGNTYHFRYMTVEEAEKMQEMSGDEAKIRDYLYSFISKVDTTAPEFAEIAKKMITPQWIRFRTMVETEFKG